jgi:predicted esterase
VRSLAALPLFAMTALGPSTSLADEAAKGPAKNGAPAWCAPETEALGAGDICHVDFDTSERRTLVVFLHGVVPRASTWQWTQQRAILREARYFHFAAIMPRAPAVGPDGAGGFAWPGGADDADADRARVDSWREAARTLETRAGRPFDEVFVIGFSSGAYYATSLALHDRMKADGYVLLAGGSPLQGSTDVPHRTPVFIGVCAYNRATAPAARALGQWLADHDWPHRVNEQPVGHMVSDLHVVRALAYLRAQVDESRPAIRTRASR